MTVSRIYPRVFLSGGVRRIFVLCDGSAPEIKLQPMESYYIPHGVPARIDEEHRYAYHPLTREGEGLWSFEYDFPVEGRYSIRIREGEAVAYYAYAYALSAELAALRPLKGDTHTHTCRSDGTGTPFEVACDYAEAGFDFVCITDHHKYFPSLEAGRKISALTDRFTVIPGEEVHNKDMGYYHIVNLGGSSSVNEIIETDDGYVAAEIARIKGERAFPAGVNPDTAAYRIFISEHIRRAGGVSVLAHPFWDAYGEYNMERAELEYHITAGTMDALELFAGNDQDGNGDTLEIALLGDLRARGADIPVLGASDNHNRHSRTTRFNRNFSIVFARGTDDLLAAIREGRTVAVRRRSDTDFLVVGEYRLVAYARFLLREFYPEYARLTARCADEMRAAGGSPTDALRAAEAEVFALRAEFFADGVNG